VVEYVTNHELSPVQPFLANFERRFSRYAWLIPVLSFAMGWASFILVHRGEAVARIIALLALVGWLWILVEPFVMNRLIGSEHPKLSSNVANFFTQSIQQEIYFFALPFLFSATQYQSFGQIVFTCVIVVAAVISTIDPWYEKHIYRHRLISFAFHALCSFVAALVILPVVVKLPTEKTLMVAVGFLVVWLLVITPKLLSQAPDWKSRRFIFAVVCAIPLCIWLLRASIPAAGLEANSAVIATGVIDNEPIGEVSSIDASSLVNGVYAYVAIGAPHGLEQEIVFKWHKGDYSETIAASITGGRAEGYRTYSMKSNFPDSAEGKWSVDVLTSQGQLLQHLEFVVSATEAEKKAVKSSTSKTKPPQKLSTSEPSREAINTSVKASQTNPNSEP
jgi:hypothetical protein